MVQESKGDTCYFVFFFFLLAQESHYVDVGRCGGEKIEKKKLKGNK